MVIHEDVSLANYSTMRLGGKATFLCEVSSEAEFAEAFRYAQENSLKIHIIGGGSNTIFSDAGFDGLIIVNKISGLTVRNKGEAATLSIGAGEIWDEVVAQSVKLGFSDIAALSFIPGTTGAAPVQNIGAYGQQVSDSIVSVRAFDLKKAVWFDILRSSCNFGYRTSRFNQEDKARFFIASVSLRLSRKCEEPPLYAQVEDYLHEHGLSTTKVQPTTLREAVIAIRRKKLPDPKEIANTGSFFKNPVVSKKQFDALTADYPALKAHQTDDGALKLYAGQLIELAGLKNYHDKATGMATWKNQALVLVNEHAKNTADLLAFKQKVVTSVHAAFGITLQQEPELIG